MALALLALLLLVWRGMAVIDIDWSSVWTAINNMKEEVLTWVGQ
jgi:hypothetical protein